MVWGRAGHRRIDLGRRRLLAAVPGAGLAVALAACTGGSSSGPTGGPDDPDGPVRAEVAGSERALVAAYDATIAAFPDLGDTLGPLREQHLAHLAAVAGADAATAGSASATAVPSSSSTAVRALRRQERDAAGERGQACERAAGADLVRVLALIAASEASHAAALRELP